MSHDSRLKFHVITQANDRGDNYALSTLMPAQSPVLTLARLLGRQLAREEFERGLAAINDNARRETGEG